MRGLRLGRLALAASLVVLLGSACTPNPGPQPTPTASATPPETAQQREQRLAYAAADKAYRDFRFEFNRLLVAGGSSGSTEGMRRTASGPYLSDFTAVVKSFKVRGFHNKGSESIVYVRPNGYSATSIALSACEDSTKIMILNRAGKLFSRGELRSVQLEIRKVDGLWKVWSGVGKKVATCD